MIDRIDHIPQGNIVRTQVGAGHKIPFFSSLVQGGFPSPAENYIESRLDLNDLCIQHPEASYFVRVTGDSMTGDRIWPGDVLVVDSARTVVDGKIVVVWYDGGHSVKRLKYVEKMIVLASSNEQYLPIYVHPGENFSVAGRGDSQCSNRTVAMFGLVDANNMYVSCECSFNPSLKGKPVVVLSNRDGCVVARSNEAKELGIKMGVPFFQIQDLREQHEIAVFSSNYTLYGDMSARLMSMLARFVEDVEVYSIDEAFLQVDGYDSLYPSYRGLGESIRDTAKQWLRIPVSIGFGPTKTLAKVANRCAKKRPELGGVCVLDSDAAIDEALSDLAVADLWGVGYRYARLLKRNGIETAAQLRDAPDEWVNQAMTVNGLRLVHELRGFPCRMLEVTPPAKKAICAAPSFGRMVPDLATIADALATHLTRACEKLRRQDSACGSLTVFLHTNRFRKTPGNRGDEPRGDGPGQPSRQYYQSRTVELPHPTSSTAELNRYAQEVLKSIFMFGHHYQKVGVVLTDLVPADYRQKGVFVEGPDERMIKLAGLMDKLNHRFGQDKLRLASQRYNPDWVMKQEYLSRRYTTRWAEILTAH